MNKKIKESSAIQTTVPNINMHLKSIYEECELEETATIKDFLIVQKQGRIVLQ